MLVHFGADQLSPQWSEAAVTIGVFDGIHLGHQALIRRAITLAQPREIPSVVVTFDRHPLSVIRPGSAPLPIATLSQNLGWMEALGVSAVVTLPFTEELASTPALEFLEDFLKGQLKASHMVVGHDFAFGRGREGTPEWLASHIPTDVLSPIHAGRDRVSSSDIRLAVSEGRMEDANDLLTRPFELLGVVVSGQKLGRTLGFPTINLAFSGPQLLPVDGIYVGEAETTKGVYRAAVSIGMRPTVDGKDRTVEAYLLDYPGESLYGSCVALRFFARLRGEEKFASLDELKTQMSLDAEKCRLWR